MRRRRAIGLLALVLALFAGFAHARPGGGSSYSGGGGHGGGGGGGDDVAFEVIWFLVRLTFAYPQVGIPLDVILVGVYVYSRSRPKAQDWDSGAHTPQFSGPSADLSGLQSLDPEFSLVLFRDFAYGLFSRAHRGRSDPKALAALAPYLSPRARTQLAARAPVGAAVDAAVIGAMRILDCTLPAGPDAPQVVKLRIEFEANLVVRPAQGAGLTQYVVDVWRLTRSAAARTRPWKGTRSFPCPSCGAPFEAAADERCASCGQVAGDGRFDWVAERTSSREVRTLPPSLTGTVPERGTDLGTVLHQEARAAWATLLKDDPGVTDDDFGARLCLVFDQTNKAWNAGDLAPARPFVSDGLCGHLEYWLDAYRAQGLRNVVDGARMTRWELAKVVRDRHYDAVTVRVWGNGKDYTEEIATHAVVGGDRRRDRPYTEYWTLIRGASVRGAPRIDKLCPGCGASLKINMGGNCEYCGALLTSGDFDWVLSTIEQDDAYGG